LISITIFATVSGNYDCAIRLLCDAQRFGLDLQAMTLKGAPNGSAEIEISLLAKDEIDGELLSARLNRHPAVLRVHTQFG